MNPLAGLFRRVRLHGTAVKPGSAVNPEARLDLGRRWTLRVLLGGTAGLLAASSGLARATSARNSHTPAPLPVRAASAYLAGVGHVRQSFNNCGPSAVLAVLQQYGYASDQRELARELRPRGGYMTCEVIAPFLRPYGLDAARYRNGQLEHLKLLLASGIPVITLQWLDRPGGIPHFRVLKGYDDRSGVFYVSDSMYPANSVISYANFSRLWGVYSQEFIPVFPLGWGPHVRAIISG